MSNTKSPEVLTPSGKPAVKTKRGNELILFDPDTGLCATATSKEKVEEQFRELVANYQPGDSQAVTVSIDKPSNPNQLPTYFSSHAKEIMQLALPSIAREKPALARLISRNIRYVQNMKGDAIAKVWNTPEGQESIIYAMEEAISMGVVLGKTGDLVPFGSAVELIPAVEAFEFALTVGKNPPFEWVQIDLIHKNDKREISQKNGDFQCSVSPGSPRGPLIQVAVYGYSNRRGHVIGEVYDVDRILEKAKVHSKSYQYYLREKAAFQAAKSEGKVQVEDGREYVVKPIKKRDGGTWNKKIFLDEISNPYEGADQPEMIRKAAGKTFLRKFFKVRDSEAAVDEMIGDSDEPDLDRTIGAALDSAQSAYTAPNVRNVSSSPAEEDEDQDDEEPQEEDEDETPEEEQSVDDKLDEIERDTEGPGLF